MGDINALMPLYELRLGLMTSPGACDPFETDRDTTYNRLECPEPPVYMYLKS